MADGGEETWRAGDIAECVCDDWSPALAMRFTPDRLPRVGDRAMVLAVDPLLFGCGCLPRPGLQLLGFDASLRWEASAFRKIVASDIGADRRVERPIGEPA